MKIDFPQPPDVWRFGDVRGAPCQIVLRGPLLMEETWELSADHAGNPVHHEDLAAGEPLGLVQHCNGVFHVADAVEQGNRGGVLGPQQTDGAQIKSLLRIAKTRAEFVQPRGEEFGAFHLLVGIGVCPHEKEQQLWILGRRGAVDRFEVFELWACRARLSLVRADSDRCIFSEGSQKSRAEHQHEDEDEKDKLSHGGNPFRRIILRNDRCIYIYYGHKNLCLCRRVRGLGHSGLHLLPTRRSQRLSQATFRRLPMWLSGRDLTLSCFRQTKDTFTPVLSRPDVDPTLPPQHGPNACASWPVHGK